MKSFQQLDFELKASHLDTIRRCLYLMILKKHSDIAKSFSSMINTRKRNMDALYNIYGDKIDQWVKKSLATRWMGLLQFCQSTKCKSDENYGMDQPGNGHVIRQNLIDS
jgi:hypothetical protein